MLRPRRRRAGATLVELLVALAITGVVVAAAARSHATTRQAAGSALARGEARRQLRAGTAAVAATLRAVARGDLLALTDTALELHATLGASVLCDATPAAPGTPPTATLLAPAGSGAAAWHDAPAAGDVLLVLVPAPPALPDSLGRAPPAWRWHRAGVRDDAVPTRRPCLGALDAPAVRVALAAELPTDAAPGAPVRLLRRARWSLYRSGGRHVLGWRDAAPGGGLDVVQPVSGPHDLRDAGGAWRPALAFAALDAFGATPGPTIGTDGVGGADAPDGRERTLAIAVRAWASAVDPAPGRGRGAVDSLVVATALRNRVPRDGAAPPP